MKSGGCVLFAIYCITVKNSHMVAAVVKTLSSSIIVII